MKMPTRHALVLSHVAFEDLGSLEAPLLERGFQIESVLAAEVRFPLPQAKSCDLLIVLGGPIGVYDQQDYPFLKDEITLIGQRLAAHKPILGICLGAQMMAAALGARVYPGSNGSEIGWFPLQAAPNSETPAWFAPLLAEGLSVFHWHGDTSICPLARAFRQRRNAMSIKPLRLKISRWDCNFIPKSQPKAWRAGTWATPVNCTMQELPQQICARRLRNMPANWKRLPDVSGAFGWTVFCSVWIWNILSITP